MTPDIATESSPLLAGSKWWCLSFIGPGLLTCLADTDGGCLIVASQSGARWGYSLLLLQIVLIPVLFFAQELTVRLGVHTKQGHTACIREHFGPFWAWATCFVLVIECTGAMVSEISAVAAVAQLWGFSVYFAAFASAFLIIVVVLAGNYRAIETIGVTLGLFELTFVATMFYFRPSIDTVISGTFTFHADPEYVKLVTANIGSVIMPWMIYFQQSAVVARRMTPGEMRTEMSHTLFGSFLTQLVMIGALVTMAAAHPSAKNLESVHEIVAALAPAAGETPAKILVSLAFIGGSLCAAFVVSLAAAWAVNEALGRDEAHSLDKTAFSAPGFYGCFLGVVMVGVIVLLAGVNIVKLNVFIEFMDGLLMPLAVGFLFLLAKSSVLPEEARIKGAYKWLLGTLFTICSAVSLGSTAYTLILG